MKEMNPRKLETHFYISTTLKLLLIDLKRNNKFLKDKVKVSIGGRETSIGCWGCFGRKWKNISYWWKLVYVWQKQMMTIWLISWLEGEILSCMDCLYFPISNIQNYPTFSDRVGSLIDNLEYLRWLYWFATNRKTKFISCTVCTHPGLLSC